MKRRLPTKGFHVVLVLLLAATFVSVVFIGRGSRRVSAPSDSTETSSPAQEATPATEGSQAGGASLPDNNPTSSDVSQPEAPPAQLVATNVVSEAGYTAASNFDAAAAQNAQLKTEMDWTFGGKAQKGWYIYVPLINQLIGTESSPDSREFAEALARWQKSIGLGSTGVLDQATLMRIISTWQSRRRMDATVATDDQMLLAPPSDCYDPGRPEALRKVEKQTYAAYKRMIAAAVSDPSLGLSSRGEELSSSEKFLKIVSAFRPPAYQEQLRAQSPNAGRAGLAKNSPHFTGRALDLYVGGEPVSTADANRAIQVQTKVYLWLVKNAARFGFVPYFYEPWHWEYRGS